MTLPKPNFSYAEYLQLPDDQRYEVLEGELVMTPAPGTDHQQILAKLTIQLGTFIEAHSLGQFYFAPVDVILADQTVVQPDFLFVRQERLDIIQQRGLFGAPDLVVEILSPATAQRDLATKRQLYSKYGVQEYWIVDPATRSIAVLTQQGSGLDTWQRYEATATLESPLLPGLALNLAKIFTTT